MSNSDADGAAALVDRLTPKVITVAALGLLALIFVFQNTATGKVRLLFWSIEAPAWVWLIGLFGIGVAVGSMFPWLRRRQP
jgi:uncharacterized integral membrane protein